MFKRSKPKNGFLVSKDRTLLIIGALFGLLLLVDFAVVFSARAELPAPAGTQAKGKHKGKKAKKPPVEVKGQPLNETELKKYQYCGSDEDCTVANNGCCDCANGGADVSVSKDRLVDFNLRFDCESRPCTMKAAVPACGTGVVSCVNHQCRYFTAADFEH